MQKIDSTLPPAPSRSPLVVTYNNSNGGSVNVCGDCEARFLAEHQWPRDWQGQEYCRVSRGRHYAPFTCVGCCPDGGE